MYFFVISYELVSTKEVSGVIRTGRLEVRNSLILLPSVE